MRRKNEGHMQGERRRKFKTVMRVATISAVVFLISAVLIYRGTYRAAFHRQIEELAAAGYPVSVVELEKRYVLPAGAENAADVYLEAFRHFVEAEESEIRWLPVRGRFMPYDDMTDYPPEVIAAIETSLEKNRRCLELLDKAAGMEHCLFPREHPKVIWPRSHFGGIRRASQLQVERNIYLAQTQQTDALFDSLQTSIAISRCLSAQPLMLDHLSTVSIQGLIACDIENCLNLTTFTEPQLASLQREIHRMRQTNTLQEALINDRAGTIEILKLSTLAQFNEAGYGMYGNVLDQPLFVLYALSGLKYRDSLWLLTYYDRMISANQLSPHEQYAEIIRIREEIGDHWLIHWFVHQGTVSHRISEMTLRAISNLLCAEAALAIERYRLDHQTLPDSLAALAPDYLDAVPLDPCAGTELRYLKRPAGGYTVYSIGADGIDHGGLSNIELARTTGTRTTSQGDWPFTVKR